MSTVTFSLTLGVFTSLFLIRNDHSLWSLTSRWITLSPQGMMTTHLTSFVQDVLSSITQRLHSRTTPNFTSNLTHSSFMHSLFFVSLLVYSMTDIPQEAILSQWRNPWKTSLTQDRLSRVSSSRGIKWITFLPTSSKGSLWFTWKLIMGIFLELRTKLLKDFRTNWRLLISLRTLSLV
jgi:hypothetical protein